MLTLDRLNRILLELSGDRDPSHLFRNYTILGEVIHVAFPTSSSLSSAYEALGKRLGDIKPDNKKKSNADARQAMVETAELATAANKLLREFGQSYSEIARNSSEREVEQLVDQAFYKSQPFKFAKWILIVGLVFVGIGSGVVPHPPGAIGPIAGKEA